MLLVNYYLLLLFLFFLGIAGEPEPQGAACFGPLEPEPNEEKKSGAGSVAALKKTYSAPVLAHRR